ncbi:hypothetical protein [Mesorhizobium sp. M0047]|uniref:hypothetical protein n=1 Tax=Mesorhizobium sp. M0047 TaxID=2956859 RepID=UPI00333DB808
MSTVTSIHFGQTAAGLPAVMPGSAGYARRDDIDVTAMQAIEQAARTWPWWLQAFGTAVGMDDDVAVDEAIVEMALYGQRLAGGDELATLAAPTGLDQRTAAAVVDDELVPKISTTLPLTETTL